MATASDAPTWDKLRGNADETTRHVEESGLLRRIAHIANQGRRVRDCDAAGTRYLPARQLAITLQSFLE